MGLDEGAEEGCFDGIEEGELVGARLIVGEALGLFEGDFVGELEGGDEGIHV